MRTQSPVFTFIVEDRDVPPPPPPPSGDDVMVYDGQFAPGTEYNYGFSSSMDFDDAGHYVFGGAPTHEGYVAHNRNAINWITPPPIGSAGDGVLEVLYPRQGKRGWAATDEFVRWFIPGYNWWGQLPGQCVFDLSTRAFLASNIAVLQAAAGDPVEDIPPMAAIIEREGNAADNNGFAPYEPAHAWSREHDVGLTIGGSHSHDRGTFIRKVTGPDGERKLRFKVWYLPHAAKHVSYGWPCKAMRRGVAFGDWFYVFGSQWNILGPGINNNPPFNARFHIPTIDGLAPHGRLPDSAMQVLPTTPYLWPNGVGYIFDNQVTRDLARNSIIDFNYRVVEIVPADRIEDFHYRDVTPAGWPTLGQIIGGYDPVTNAHYISNGFTPAVGASCLNLIRPRVGITETDPLGQPDPAVVLSNGDPLFKNAARMHRFRFVKGPQ